MSKKKTNVAKNIEDAIKRIENKESFLYFFVIDTKGVPTGSLAYIYETALYLSEQGYDVRMLHAEKEDFVGVRDWLGDKYADLPHYDIEKDTPAIGPADFLFIPEVYSNVMSMTKDLPCRRIMILQNFRYMSEMIPAGVSLSDLKMHDCITTSEHLRDVVHEFFPNTSVKVVHPAIQDMFFAPLDFESAPKKLVINVVSKSPSDVDAIIKPFYWKYPNYGWIAFRPIVNLPREKFAEALKEAVATIWCDTKTNFGYDALEAMASGSIVIGKVPDDETEWLYDKEGVLKDNGLWFYDFKGAADVIASVVQSFIADRIPDGIYHEMQRTADEYSVERQHNEIDKAYGELFTETANALKIILEKYKNEDNG